MKGFRLSVVKSPNLVKRLSCLIAILLLTASAGFAQFYPDKKDFRMGMIFGGNPSTTIGTELKNARASFGIQSGMYYRAKINKATHYELGFNAALRGSKYNHSKDDYYNQLSLVVLELPLLYLVDISKNTEKQMALVGIVPSRIVQSEFYIVPEQTARDEFRNKGLNKTDIALTLGYHINTYYAGWRISAQVGLIDLNNDLELQDIEPSTGNGGNIRSIALNLQVYF